MAALITNLFTTKFAILKWFQMLCCIITVLFLIDGRMQWWPYTLVHPTFHSFLWIIHSIPRCSFVPSFWAFYALPPSSSIILSSNPTIGPKFPFPAWSAQFPRPKWNKYYYLFAGIRFQCVRIAYLRGFCHSSHRWLRQNDGRSIRPSSISATAEYWKVRKIDGGMGIFPFWIPSEFPHK